MRCKKIQGLLSADYLDHELKGKARQDIERHLAGCQECRGLAEKLQVQRRLFQKAKSEPAPDRVWLNIRDAIIAQRLQEEARASRGIFSWLKDLFWQRQPALALASALTIVLFILVFAGVFIQRQAANINAAELYGLGEKNGSVIYSLGTSVEEYFL
jgi:anti-sigma factor RsiW